MRQRAQAICLRATNYSETSQVVAFLTRESGVVRMIAKGTKRPKSKSGGAIDLMSEGELVYTPSRSGGLGTLVEFVETETHRDIRADAAKLKAALFLLELSGEMLAAEDPHPEVFDLLHNALERLGQAKAPIPAVVSYFLWRLTHHAGVLGQLDACVVCGEVTAGKRGRHWFSSSQGGMVCDGCAAGISERVPVDGTTRAALAALSAAAGGQRVALPEPQAVAVGKLLSYHVAYQLGKRLKMARHVFGGGNRGYEGG